MFRPSSIHLPVSLHLLGGRHLPKFFAQLRRCRFRDAQSSKEEAAVTSPIEVRNKGVRCAADGPHGGRDG